MLLFYIFLNKLRNIRSRSILGRFIEKLILKRGQSLSDTYNDYIWHEVSSLCHLWCPWGSCQPTSTCKASGKMSSLTLKCYIVVKTWIERRVIQVPAGPLLLTWLKRPRNSWPRIFMNMLPPAYDFLALLTWILWTITSGEMSRRPIRSPIIPRAHWRLLL